MRGTDSRGFRDFDLASIPTATHSQACPGWRLGTLEDSAPPHPHQQFPSRAFTEAVAQGRCGGRVYL